MIAPIRSFSIVVEFKIQKKNKKHFKIWIAMIEKKSDITKSFVWLTVNRNGTIFAAWKENSSCLLQNSLWTLIQLQLYTKGKDTLIYILTSQIHFIF